MGLESGSLCAYTPRVLCKRSSRAKAGEGMRIWLVGDQAQQWTAGRPYQGPLLRGVV